MNKGDIVTIYDNPLTSTEPWGEAELLEKLGDLSPVDGRQFESWRVRMLDTDRLHGVIIRDPITCLYPATDDPEAGNRNGDCPNCGRHH